MASTYEPIATTTLGSNGTVTFSSIPQTYTDLVFVFNGTSTYTSDAGAWLKIQINGDTGSNYSSTYLYGTGASAASNRLSGNTNAYVVHVADNQNTSGNSQPSTGIVNFLNYSNTTTYKTYLSRSASVTNNIPVDAVVNLWRSTAAITSLYIYCDGTNFVTGSTFTLYGIKAA